MVVLQNACMINADPEPVVDDDGTVLRPALMTGGDLRKYQIEGLNWLKVKILFLYPMQTVFMGALLISLCLYFCLCYLMGIYVRMSVR